MNNDQQPIPLEKPNKPASSLPPVIVIILVVISIACGFIGGWLIKGSLLPKQDTTSSTEELLFVIDGDIVVKGDTLTIADELIEWFSESPNRDAGHLTPQDFLGIWNQSNFTETPPNAALANIDAIVELSSPTINKDGGLTFTFKIVSGSLGDGTFADGSLFIDAFPTSVNGQITDAVTQASASDTYCSFSIAPWSVTTQTVYATDTMACDQKEQIVSSFLSQLEQKSYTFTVPVSSQSPQPNTAWNCSGAVRPLAEAASWQLEDAKCVPIDQTLAKTYGFTISGQAAK